MVVTPYVPHTDLLVHFVTDKLYKCQPLVGMDTLQYRFVAEGHIDVGPSLIIPDQCSILYTVHAHTNTHRPSSGCG